MKVYRKPLIGLALVSLSIFSSAQTETKKDSSRIKKWFPYYNFNAASFQKPPLEFAPFARWWWPGNDVTGEELIREINLFADHGFGGVEIQPLNLFIPGSKEQHDRVVSWDSPGYYENVRTVMEEALKRGITVDMTDGSGWPPGGPHLTADDGFLNLQFADLDIKGGTIISQRLPAISNTTGFPSKLVTVLATKKLPKDEGDITPTILLDPSSTIILTPFVKNDSLHWKAPTGDWKVIAFWSKPSGEKGMTASPVQGYVVNHFDSLKVMKNYLHLFGERTGLQPYFGNPLRAIFNDSYEFAVDRFFSPDFLLFFKKNRGYDITPWLPAEMQKKYNYASYMRPPASPDFSFSTEDWRLRFDYDLTLSELLGEHFFKTSKNWMEPRGLLHRTQAYGLNMDMIAQAGLASIPETENMLAAEANLKIMSSGAHLYNRPIISAESVVFKDRAYTTTPQKIKLAVDKLFAAGINQVIYHGVPYRYTPPELGPEGWYPFSTPLINFVNFSSNLGEGNIFWKFQKDINGYINRVQYALRSGKPQADLLVYFPFMEVDGMPDNPEEILTKGVVDGVEGPLPPNKDPRIEAKERWAEKVYPLINQLEANGISWDWVNDVSIQQAQLNSKKQILIRGNIYKALVLANDSVIQLKTAQKINELASKGMNFIASGSLPGKQPSFLNWKLNDQKTKALIASALKSKTPRYINNENELREWIKTLNPAIAFNGEYHFTRQVQRNMSDGSRIQFIWNKSDQWQALSLTLDKVYKAGYWMNPENGMVTANNSSVISYQLPPYGSILLFASTVSRPGDFPAQVGEPAPGSLKNMVTIDQWNLKADSLEVKNSALFDWKSHDQLKYSSAVGIYESTFDWKEEGAAHFYLDLGRVYFTAEVFINDRPAGTRIFAPYRLDISSFLVKGLNKIEIHVTPGQLNGFIGKAKQGDVHYKQFKNKEDQLMSAGLAGPVVITAAMQ